MDIDGESIDHYPRDVQDILLRIDAEVTARDQHFLEHAGHRERSESGRMIHYGRDGAIFCDTPTDYYFGLSYASWLTLPRMSLREMPLDWQVKFYALLEEAENQHGFKTPEGLVVMRKVAGKFVSNTHWNNYRHGNPVLAEEIDNTRPEEDS